MLILAFSYHVLCRIAFIGDQAERLSSQVLAGCAMHYEYYGIRGIIANEAIVPSSH